MPENYLQIKAHSVLYLEWASVHASQKTISVLFLLPSCFNTINFILSLSNQSSHVFASCHLASGAESDINGIWLGNVRDADEMSADHSWGLWNSNQERLILILNDVLGDPSPFPKLPSSPPREAEVTTGFSSVGKIANSCKFSTARMKISSFKF